MLLPAREGGDRAGGRYGGGFRLAPNVVRGVEGDGAMELWLIADVEVAMVPPDVVENVGNEVMVSVHNM